MLRPYSFGLQIPSVNARQKWAADHSDIDEECGAKQIPFWPGMTA
jgi:hypothetical protein